MARSFKSSLEEKKWSAVKVNYGWLLWWRYHQIILRGKHFKTFQVPGTNQAKCFSLHLSFTSIFLYSVLRSFSIFHISPIFTALLMASILITPPSPHNLISPFKGAIAKRLDALHSDTPSVSHSARAWRLPGVWYPGVPTSTSTASHGSTQRLLIARCLYLTFGPLIKSYLPTSSLGHKTLRHSHRLVSISLFRHTLERCRIPLRP